MLPQLVMKGIPPRKREVTEGEVGLDIGISTFAAVSDKEVMIEEFCEGLDMLEKEKRMILRKMDLQDEPLIIINITLMVRLKREIRTNGYDRNDIGNYCLS